MLEQLSDRFQKVFKYLKGEAKITEDNMKAALREIKLSLLEADVNYKVVKEFTEKVRAQSLGSEVAQSLSPYQQVVKIVRSELEAMLGGSSRELKTSSVKPAVIMMTGLQGTGKTTSTGKLALHLRQQGRSVLLCSIDLKRLAAVEQLRTIASEMQLPFFEPKGDNPVTIGKNLLAYAREYGYDVVLVDTAGRLHIDEALMDELLAVHRSLDPLEVIYVADALTGQDAVNSALAFNEKIPLDSVLLTKMDADARGGAALSIVSVTGLPIKFVGVGEKPGDLERFYPDRMASKILGMGDVLSLIERAEQQFDEKQAERMAQKLMRSEFTLEDFRDQLVQVTKLGSMSEIMAMLPGKLSAGVRRDQIDDEKNARRMKHMVAIINSMTTEERVNPRVINGKRRVRIARGAGRAVSEVNQLLKQYMEIKSVMKKPMFRKLLKKFDFLSKMG